MGLDIIIKVHEEITTLTEARDLIQLPAGLLEKDRPCLIDFVIPRQHPDGHELIASKELRFMNEFQHFVISKHEFTHFDITGKTTEFMGSDVSKSSTTDKDKENQKIVGKLLSRHAYLVNLEQADLNMSIAGKSLLNGLKIQLSSIVKNATGKDIKDL